MIPLPRLLKAVASVTPETDTLCRRVSGFYVFPTFEFENSSGNGAGDEDRTRNFQLGKLDVSLPVFNNLQNCSGELTLPSLQVLQVLPALHPLVGQWWDNSQPLCKAFQSNERLRKIRPAIPIAAQFSLA